MSRNARIEEVEDSDSDPPDMDPSDFDPSDIIAPSAMRSAPSAPLPPSQHLFPEEPELQPMMRLSQDQAAQRESVKHWQCLYPVYFDANRSRAEGRRVGKEEAVQNPLARDIIDAVLELGLQPILEADKTHPKDWSNPGRVRVLLKEDGRQVARHVNNKHHLYNLVAKYLKEHPATPESSLKIRIQGLPMPKETPGPPAIPRGWKMNTIIPFHSPAMSGGGISDDFMKDMMAEMQGRMDPSGQISGGSASGGEAKKKKEKKKGK